MLRVNCFRAAAAFDREVFIMQAALPRYAGNPSGELQPWS